MLLKRTDALRTQRGVFRLTAWVLGSLLVVSVALSVMTQAVYAVVTVPTKMNFQGRLTNSAGNVMADGLYNMKFRLFTVSSGGSAVWLETRETTNRVQVANGLFSIQLGSVTTIPDSLFASGPLYVEVELPTPATATCSTAACGSFTEGAMTPRNQMATSAYAFNSETLDGLDSSSFGQLTANNTFTGLNIFKPSADSATAFRVQNAGGSDIISVDTLTGSTTIKTSTSGATLRLLGTNTGASNIAVMGVYDSAGTRVGYLGDGFTGSSSMYLQADTGNSVNLGINGGISLNVDGSGDVQIGTQNGSMSGHALAVSNTSASPMAVRRNTNDGNLISFYRDATLQGSISVAGATISYNAFTGSHYGWMSEPAPDRGALVTMTGDNRYTGEQEKSEIVYGVALTTVPNDSAVLGSYLALSEPSKPFSQETNQHQIMSVGNGDMWVSETNAGNIKPGDELISSTVAGHAMKDTGAYPVSNVVARASEKVDWSKVTTNINGVKHIRIAVLFGAYTKNNASQAQGLSTARIYVGDVANIETLVLDGHLVGNEDTRGRLKIPAGETSATHYFSNPYSKQPFVVVSPEGEPAQYYVNTNQDSLTVTTDATASRDRWFVYMVQE